jgi:hypothetical protein
VGNHLLATLRVQSNFSNDQRSTDLYQLAHAHDGLARRRFPQEVNRQAGRHGQRNDADGCKNSDVHCNISHRHQQWTRDGFPGSQVIGAHLVRDRGGTVTYLLDDTFVLRKFARQKIDYVGFTCHSSSPSSLDASRQRIR